MSVENSGAFNYQALAFWIGIGQWVFNAIIAAYLWVSRRRVATKRRLDEVNKRIERAEKDMLQLQGRLDQQPNQRQFDTLGKDIRSLTSELGQVKGRLEGINRVADLMNEFLINQGGKQ